MNKKIFLLVIALIGFGIYAEAQAFRTIHIESDVDRWRREEQERLARERVQGGGTHHQGGYHQGGQNFPGTPDFQRSTFNNGILLALIEQRVYPGTDACRGQINDAFVLTNISTRPITIIYAYRSIIVRRDGSRHTKVRHHTIQLSSGASRTEAGWQGGGGCYFVEAFQIMNVTLH